MTDVAKLTVDQLDRVIRDLRSKERRQETALQTTRDQIALWSTFATKAK